MSFLDMRTLVFGHVITDTVCAVFMLFLWHRNRRRFSGLSFWAADFALQIVSVILLLLRGSIPDFISMVAGNGFAVAGALLMLMGLRRLFGQKGHQAHNYILLAAYLFFQTWFAIVYPNLSARNLNFSAVILVITFQCMWLLLRGVERGLRPLTRGAALVFAMYAAVNLARALLILAGPIRDNDFFKSGVSDDLVILTFQVLFIAQTYSLVLMVNRLLLKDVREHEQRHRVTLMSVGDAVITTDAEGRVEVLNPVAQALTGWGTDEARGKHLDEIFRIINEETRQPVPSPVGKVLKDGTAVGLANRTVLVFRDQTEERLVRRRVQIRLDLIEYAEDHSLDELLTRALDEIGELVQSPIGFYHFVEPEQQALSLVSWSTRTKKEFCHAETRGRHYPIDQAGVWADCVKARMPVIHNDYASLPHKKGMPEGHATVVRELVVPVMRDGRVVAVLGVGNKPSDYTEKNAATVSLMADVTWEVVKSQKAREELRVHLGMQRVIAELGQRALAGADTQGLLELALDRMSETLGTELVKVLELLPDGSALILRAGVGWTEGLVGRATVGVGKDSLAGYTLSMGGPIIVEDLRTERRFTGPPLLTDHGVVSGVGVVIGDPRAPWGVLGVHTREQRTFLKSDVNFIQAVANVLGEAIGRKREEEQKRDSEQRYRLLFEASPDGVLLAGPDGAVHAANPAACAMLGAAENELCALGISGIADPQDSRLSDLLADLRRSGRASGELRLRRANGALFEVEMSSGRFLDTAGFSRSWLILRDVSARKALESSFLQAQKMESVGRLAGGIAHDFNNMLQVIISYSEISLQQVDPHEKLHKNLQQIFAAARRSADLTGQLLAFARKQTVSPRVLDLADAVEGTLKMLRRLIGEDINLVWKPGDAGGKVRLDPSQLDQILTNLAVNARDAITGVGKLTIETCAAVFDNAYCAEHAGYVPGQYMMLGVSDNGHGMDKETMSHLFEPFFTTKAMGKGTGLGLATLYGIVRQNEGFVNVYSEPGAGTTFRIYLPRVTDEEASALQSAAEQLRGGNETILVVEDEEAILELSKDMLAELGYSVLTAQTPALAIGLAEAHRGKIDLLITDVVMPGMNGRELAGRLRATRPGLRCLYMSGHTADVIAHQGVLEDGVSFLPKPFSLASLAQKVRAVLET